MVLYYGITLAIMWVIGFYAGWQSCKSSILNSMYSPLKKKNKR